MSKNLLLADDSITIQKVVGIIFADGDYTLTTVGDGDSALQKAGAERPDLILADVCMPGKNGYELCAAVKRDPALRSVPVLLLTGTFEPFDESKALGAHADGWIAKPFESQSLIRKVEELLQRAAEAAQMEATLEEQSPPQESNAREVWSDLVGFDAAQADPLPASEPQVDLPPSSAEPALEDDIWGDLESEMPPSAELDGDFEFGEPEEVPTPQEGPDPFAFAEEDGAADEEFPAIFEDEEDDPFAAEPEPLAGIEIPSAPLEEEESWDFLPRETAADLQEDEEVFLLDEDDIIEDDAFDADVFAGEESVPLYAEQEEELPSLSGDDGGYVVPVSVDEPEEEWFTDDSAPSVAAGDFTALQGAPPEKKDAEELPSLAAAGRVDGDPAEPAPSRDDPFQVGADDFLAAYAETPAGYGREVESAAAEPAPELEPEPDAGFSSAPPPATSTPAAALEERISALSEEEIARIVEKVAGTVVERLAQTMLERIAWEVVPDLAEVMIKEEIRKIREEASAEE